MNLMLAKSNPVETIKEHTDNLLEQFEKLKETYPAIQVNWDILRYACLYHDLGKINTKFQNKLLENLGENLLNDVLPQLKEVPHGYLSVAFLPIDKLEENYNEEEIKVLYQSIFYHHTRPTLNDDKIIPIIKKDLPQYISLLKEKWKELSDIEEANDDILDYCNGKDNRITEDKSGEEVFRNYVRVKGLLNKIDYAASAHIDVEINNKQLGENVLRFMKENSYQLNDLQKYLIQNRDSNNIIIASTGIGKTEAALLWIGEDKGIFTLPIKVSINAIYKRIKDKVKFKEVGLLHSDTIAEYVKEVDDKEDFDISEVNKSRQLSYPLTISTLDQIIDFVAMYPGFELKLATLSYTRLIVDEIQMYSPNMIAFLILGLKRITEFGGKFTILTATLPPIIKDFMNRFHIPYVEPKQPFIKKDTSGLDIVRHRMEVIEDDISVEKIKANGQNRKILIIVNTVTKAQQLFDELKEKFCDRNINLLHSRFIRSDRARKERNIIEMGSKENRDSGIWVTTQIVEASLDIDFDILYTELSDVCGLFQRMGRVYRDRVLEDEHTNVIVYLGKEYTSGISKSSKSVVDEEIFKLSKEEIKKYHNVILNEELKIEIVNRVYSKSTLENTNYYKQINTIINIWKDIQPYELEKSQVRLRDIHDVTIIPTSVYLANSVEIDELAKISKNRNAKLVDRELAKERVNQYTTTIPTWADIKANKEKLIHSTIRIDYYNTIKIISYNYTEEKGIVFIIDEDTMFF